MPELVTEQFTSRFLDGRLHQLPHPHSVVYICAPYGNTDPETVKMNVEDAEQLARFAVHMGYSPVVVHSYIDQVFGDDRNPDLRKRGLAHVVSVAWAVARAGGYLWVIKREDGTLSDGCAQEVNMFKSVYGKTLSETHIVSGSFADWCTDFARWGFKDGH